MQIAKARGTQMPFPQFRILTPIVHATPADLAFVVALQKKHSGALGFLPTAALEWYIEHKRVTLTTENTDAAGYLLGRTHFRWQPLMRPITQAAVLMDVQRRHHGLRLVDQVVEQASLAGQYAVQAMCAADLDSVEFWKAAGFREIGRYSPDNKRNRAMICFRRPLTPASPAWFNVMPPLAGWKGKRVELCQTNTNTSLCATSLDASLPSGLIRPRMATRC